MLLRIHQTTILLYLLFSLGFSAVGFAQYKAIITDLNTNAELEIAKNKTYYLQQIGNKHLFQTKLIEVKNELLIFDSVQLKVDQISWMSSSYFKNNSYKQWCRNHLRNWGLCHTPDFDLQQNHLLEITNDTASLLLDSSKFSRPNNKQLLHAFIPQLAYNLKMQAISPFRISGQQWAKTFLNVFVIGAVSLTDQVIDDGLRKTYNQNSFPVRSSNYISLIGSEVGLGFTALWLGKGLLTHSSKSTETALLAFQAALSATVWNRVLKYSTLRERPYSAYQNNHTSFSALGPTKLKTYFTNSDYHSFGSGHTATAFALATVFAEQYEDVPFIKVICYSLATAVGLSRMTQHKHWGSDVLMGAMLGYACGKQITSMKQIYYKKVSKKYKIDTSISPFAFADKVYPTLCFSLRGI